MTSSEHGAAWLRGLRAEAIAALSATPRASAEPTPTDLPSLLHELQVKQVQLDLLSAELQAMDVRLTESRESEERSRAAFEQTAVGITHVAPNGRYLRANQRYCDLVGYSREELLARTFHDITHPDDLERDLENARAALAGMRASYMLEKRYIRKDGTVVWVMLAAALLRGADGEPRYFVAVVQDITDRRAAESLLRIQRDLALSLSSGSSLPGALQQVLQAALQMEGVDCGGIYLVDEANGSLHLAVHAGLSPEFLASESHFVADSPQARLVARGEPLYVCGSVDERSQVAVQREGLRAIACVPIQHGGRVLAAWNVASRTRNDFPANTRHGLETIGAELGSVIARLRTEDSLADRSRELETLTDNAPDLIARFDAAFRHVFVNRRWTEETGIPRAAALGRRIGQLGLPRELCAAWEATLARVFEQRQRQEFEFEFDGPQGRRQYQSRVVPELSPNGRVDSAVSFTSDVTAQRRMQADLAQAQKMEIVGQLAAGVAHDINNALTAISGYAALARAELPGEHAATALLDELEEAAQHAGGVTKTLLTFSRKLPATRQPVRMPAVVDSALRMLRRMLPSSTRFHAEGTDATDGWVFGDGAQIEQIVLNLAINARDAMPDGGSLRVALSTDQRQSSDEPPLGWIRLTISDTGTGIAPEVLPRIFDPFFTTKPLGQGTGLGLAIVRSVVSDHGGEISVASQPGHGATFTVRLPRIAPPTATVAAATSQDTVHGHGELILVAEDNTQVRDVIFVALRDAGYNVLPVADAVAAQSQFARWPERIRLLIVDVDLPGGSGVDCLHRLRRVAPRIPGLLITGDVDIDLRDAEDERTRVLRKPFRLDELLLLTAALLQPSIPADATP